MSFSRIQLIGLQQRNPAEGDYRMIASAFTRLPTEIMRPGQLNRMIGYHCVDATGRQRLWFLGAKVIEASNIPAEMVLWELGDHSFRISEMRDNQLVLIEEHSIKWVWRKTLATDPGQWIGEFEWADQSDKSTNQRMTIFAIVPFDPQKGGMQDDVALVPYDSDWPKQFERMSAWLQDKLGPDIALRIEHYGSTAIPGLSAKPVIDVLVEIPSFEQAAPQLLSEMGGPLWEFWRYSNHDVFFYRQELMGPRQYHIHCAPKGHAIWHGLAFRDYLRAHPQTAREYQQLKEKLVREFSKDREAYTQAKTEFVQNVTKRALREMADR